MENNRVCRLSSVMSDKSTRRGLLDDRVMKQYLITVERVEGWIKNMHSVGHAVEM